MGLDKYETIMGEWEKPDSSLGGWERDYKNNAELICDDPDFRIWKEKEGGYLHGSVRRFSPAVWRRIQFWIKEYGKDKDLLAPHFWCAGRKQVKFLHILGFEYESLAVKNGEPVSVFRRKSDAR